jgi:RHS repeat-associated protein
VWFGDEPVATVNVGTGQVDYLLHDPRELPRVGVQPTGNATPGTIVWRNDALPFGTPALSGTLQQNLRLPGQVADPNAGWEHNGYRDYMPTWGRYMQADPIGLAGGMNGYRYALDNPFKWVDPWGMNTQFSITGSFTGSAFFGVGANGGIGISVPDNLGDWRNYQIFGSAQFQGMVGVGLYAGYGINVNVAQSNGNLPAGLTTSSSWYGEADGGLGLSFGDSIQGSLPCDKAPWYHFNGSATGVGLNPLPKIGEGFGLWAGSGEYYGVSANTQSFGNIYNKYIIPVINLIKGE